MPRMVNGRGGWASELANAFGEDPNFVRSITFQIAADSVAVVTIEKYVTTDQAKRILTVIQKHAWVENEAEDEEAA